jgi:nucleoside-diphosphate-sugar epimerase/lipopolysaccharide/colanic/teichoic acid biosynthesis glycosyltransferase
MILVTGATGLVGKAVVKALLGAGQPVVAAVRQLPGQHDMHNSSLRWAVVGSINNQTKWCLPLWGVDTVLHCAARTHVMREHAVDALALYREVNVEGTLNFAQQAAEAGVRRFVFISSIKVNGEANLPGQPFTEECDLAPQDAYSQSKAEAERALLALAAQTGMELVIVRPPLVYGPGVKGNFEDLAKAVRYGLPLPLGAVHNKRSLVALDNLVSLVLLCADRIRSPLAANQIFVVADGLDVSTTMLLRKMAQTAGRPSRLLPVPVGLLRAAARLLGKRAHADRLLNNLQVNASKARTLLGWRPVVTMDEQLAKMLTMPTACSRPLLRLLDVALSAVGLLALFPLLLLVCLVSWFDIGSPLFIQARVGRHQRPFMLIKFRTMLPETPHMASHLVGDESITRWGALLRRTKLDELPQLWNVLLGNMSLVGPRPCLLNQQELIQARAARGVYALRPGITGFAQVKGIDMSAPELLAQTDARMLRELNLCSYFKYIFFTIFGNRWGGGALK